MASMFKKRVKACACIVDDEKIYVFGGAEQLNSNGVMTIEVYDIDTNVWKECYMKLEGYVPYSFANVAQIDDTQLMLYGGSAGDPTTSRVNDCYCVHLTQNRIEKVQNLPVSCIMRLNPFYVGD